MIKKFAALALSAILACSILVGCGDDEDSSSKKSKKNSSEASTVDNSGDEDSDDEDSDDESDEESDPDYDSEADDPNIGDSDDDSSKSKKNDDSSKKNDDSSKTEVDPDDLYYDKNLVGKWECKQVTDGDTTYTKEYKNKQVKAIRLEFAKDNTGASYTGTHKSNDLLWSYKDGSGITFPEGKPSEVMSLKLKDEELVVSAGELKLRFKKVDEFSDLDDDSKSDSKVDPDGDVDAKYVGKWECSGANIDGTGYSTEDIDAGGKKVKVATLFQFEFKADGTGVAKSAMSSKDEALKWKVKGNTFYIYDDEETVEFEISGSELICKTDDMDFKLKKVSDFTK